MRVLLDIPYDAKGFFIERKNRFLGIVELDGKIIKAHIHDPGRLREILYPGNSVLLKGVRNRGRKTAWDIVAGFSNDEYVFIHSGYHSIIAEAILNDPFVSPFGSVNIVKKEPRLDGGRLDFLVEKNGRNIWIEVKGCTLERGGIALFPDAPTERGRRHLEALISLKEKGERAAVLILVFRSKSRSFMPNEEAGRRFSEVFWRAFDIGVEFYPILLCYNAGKILYRGRIWIGT